MMMIDDIFQFLLYFADRSYSEWFIVIPMVVGILSLVMFMINFLNRGHVN